MFVLTLSFCPYSELLNPCSKLVTEDKTLERRESIARSFDRRGDWCGISYQWPVALPLPVSPSTSMASSSVNVPPGSGFSTSNTNALPASRSAVGSQTVTSPEVAQARPPDAELNRVPFERVRVT